MRLEAIVIVVAVLATFSGVIGDYFIVADDFVRTWIMHDVVDAHPDLAGQLHGVFFKAEGKGHYKPVQDVFFILSRHFFGPLKWSKAMMLVYMAYHCASGLLIAHLLRSLGAPRALGLFAALAFVVHPAYDENLAACQLANNVPGTTFMLIAAACCLVRPGRLALRMTGAVVASFCAVGYGPNLACTLALLGGAVAILNFWNHRSWKQTLIPLAAVALGVALALALRLEAYGTLGSKHGHYEELEPVRDAGRFAGELWRGSVLLERSGTASWLAKTNNPRGATHERFRAELVSGETGIVLLICLFMAAGIFLSGRRSERPLRRSTDGWGWKTAFLGAAIVISTCAPYYIWLGRIGSNRYSYPAVVGVVMLFAILVQFLTRPVSKLARGQGALVLAIVAVPVLMIPTWLSRESARSIAAGHRIVRGIVEAVENDLADEPEVDRLYAMGWPAVVGRSGYTITFNPHLPSLLRRRMKRDFLQGARGLLYDLEKERIAFPLGPQTAVFIVAKDGKSVRRVHAKTLADLGDAPRVTWRARLRKENPRKAILAADPQLVAEAIDIYATEYDGQRAHNIGWGLDKVFAPAPAKGVDLTAGVGLAEPENLARAFRVVAPLQRWKVGLAAVTASNLGGENLRIGRAVLEVAKRAKPRQRALLACNVGVWSRKGSKVEQECIDLMGPELDLASDAETLRDAFELERRAWGGLLRLDGLPEAERHLIQARNEYKKLAILRPSVSSLLARCRAAQVSLEDLPARIDVIAKDPKQTKLLAELRVRKYILETPKPPLRVELRPRHLECASGQAVTLLPVVINDGTLDLPGHGGIAGSGLVWRWLDVEGKPVGTGAQLIPHELLVAGRAHRVPIYTRAPEKGGEYHLLVTLVVSGRDVAVANVWTSVDGG